MQQPAPTRRPVCPPPPACPPPSLPPPSPNQPTACRPWKAGGRVFGHAALHLPSARPGRARVAASRPPAALVHNGPSGGAHIAHGGVGAQPSRCLRARPGLLARAPASFSCAAVEPARAAPRCAGPRVRHPCARGPTSARSLLPTNPSCNLPQGLHSQWGAWQHSKGSRVQPRGAEVGPCAGRALSGDGGRAAGGADTRSWRASGPPDGCSCAPLTFFGL
jgi:hypothetical protein